jgi:hypothetical protein
MKLALAALAFAFVPPQADSLALKLEQGAKLTKSLSMTMDLELDEVGMSLGGRDVPDEILEKFEMAISYDQELRAEDEYVALEGKRAKELLRRYTKASQTQKMHFEFPGAPSKDQDETVESPLVDKQIAFTWDEKEEKYARAFRGDEGEQALLGRLEEGMDFEKLLPAEEVEEGATWKLEAKDFDAVTLPGGAVSFPKKEQSGTNPFEGGFTGEVEARYDGKREVEGRKLSVIHLTAQLKLSKLAVESAGIPMDISFSCEIEGDYLWDQERGRLQSYELAGPATMELSASKEIEVREQKLEMLLEMTLTGEFKLAGKIE